MRTSNTLSVLNRALKRASPLSGAKRAGTVSYTHLAGLAYLVGAFGNLFTGSVTPISSQAETITVASVKKDLRNNVSSILLAAVLMIILGLCGGVTKISESVSYTHLDVYKRQSLYPSWSSS